MSAYPAGFDGKSFQDCQEKILNINETHQKAVQKVEIERDVATNAVYASRAAVIKAKGPKDFWAQVIGSHKDMSSELLGDYDREILKSLTDFNVSFRPDGAVRVEMTFAKNDFFSDEKLWAEEDVDRHITFSGINWKSGFGPYTAEEEIAREAAVGEKRDRDGENRGQTMFQFFSIVPVDPLEAIPDAAELDEDEIEDILEDFKDMVEDRKELFRALVEEVWAFPTKILKNGTVA